MFYQQQQYLGVAGSFEQQKDNVGDIGVNLMYSPLDNISMGHRAELRKA